MNLFGTFHRLLRPAVATRSLSHSAADDVVVDFDGRLDDANDLRAELGLPWPAGGDAIATAAYRRWGDDFLTHLTGEFALALWDARAERLLLARDCFGVRPLFYHRTPEAITWSSQLEPLLDETGCDRTPDDDYVAAVLLCAGRLDVSPYKAIAAVPPATLLVFTRDAQSLRTYWQLDPQREIRLASDAEYEERFFTLFRRSVRNRLQSDGPVFADLSGGVDSTSIAMTADQILRDEGRPADALQTVSQIYDDVAQWADQPFIERAERMLARPAHHVLECDAPIFSSIEQGYEYEAPSPYWAGAEIQNQVAARMQARGATVRLSGLGGDHVCHSQIETPPPVADHVASLRLGAAVREARAWSATTAVPQLSILTGAARDAFAARFRNRQHLRVVPPWIRPQFAKGRDIEVGAFRVPSRREFALNLHNFADSIRLHHGITPSIDVRYPFADRDLVEFAFAIPVEQHLRPHETRSLQRRATARVLPGEIAYRRTKGGPAKALYLRLRQVWPVLRPLIERDGLRVVDRGYADRPPLLDALHRAGHGQNVNAPGLMRVLSVEFWLRKLERAAASSETGRRNPAIAAERR